MRDIETVTHLCVSDLTAMGMFELAEKFRSLPLEMVRVNRSLYCLFYEGQQGLGFGERKELKAFCNRRYGMDMEYKGYNTFAKSYGLVGGTYIKTTDNWY